MKKHACRFCVPFLLAILAIAPVFAEEAKKLPPALGEAQTWLWHDAPMGHFGINPDEATVLRVTTLAGKGEGSLREAVEAEIDGARLIVFEVGGVIDLEGRSLSINQDHTWIAGQTAPEPGISIIRGGLRVGGSHIVLQHLRIRPGDGGDLPDKGWEPDGLTTGGACHDVLVEHCSLTWSVDENLSASSYGAPEGQGARRLTFRENLIAEALNEATHAKGGHSKGTLVHDGSHEVAIVGNLYAANVERNPLFKLDTSGVVVNNVIACPGARAIHGSEQTADYQAPLARISVVGNTVLLGEDSKSSAGIFEGKAEGFFEDNVGADREGSPLPLLRDSFLPEETPPVWPQGLHAAPATAAQWKVVRFAGARSGQRDAIDARIVEQAMAGTLKIIDSQDEVGGYPKIEPATSRVAEVPGKHRDAWLENLAREVEGRESRRPTTERPRDYTQVAVATVNPLATEAAIQAYEKGGNAVDAAIAAAITLGIVDAHNSGIGGGCFILIRAADGTLTAIDGREMAPAAATRDMYLVDGKADPELSRTGPLASGVPGSLAAWELALKKHGNLELADIFLPAAKLAEAGFPIDEVWARKLKGVAGDIASFPVSAAVFLNADGEPMKEGDTIKQADLAKSYRAIAEHGSDWFYRGPFAETTAAWMAENGGILTAEDFANYVPKLREPLVTTYRGLDIIGFPPPSSGGIHVAQMLQILEHFDLPKLEPAQRTHLIAETMKLAFADRAHWLGDADYAPVPRGLIDPAYAEELAKKIDLEKVTEVPGHGTPPRADSDFFGGFDDSKHTQHLCTADGFGNWVSMTSTINTAFGSKVVIPGTGIVLNNEMDDFSAQPGVPNAFGLVGAEANAIEPGKRPLSSMSPTLVIREGRVAMAIGAAGGPTIITQTLQNIVNRFTLGMDIDDSLAAPRVHHQWSPDTLRIEKSMDPTVIESLKALGHDVSLSTRGGVSQGITADHRYGTLRPAHDPRVPGGAGGK